MSVIAILHIIFHLLTIPLFCMDLKLGVILPSDPKYPWSLKRVLPAIDIAVETAQKHWGLLTHLNISVNASDSKCSETFGPLAAVDFFMYKTANVFIGPVCDYAIAPIARFSPYWNIPVLSGGAFVSSFDNKSEYKLLTRVHGAYSNGADFFLAIAHAYNWTRLGLIYHDNKDENQSKGKSNCYFKMEALFYKLAQTFGFEPWYAGVDENLPEKYDFRETLLEASQNVRSKSLFTYSFQWTLVFSFVSFCFFIMPKMNTRLSKCLSECAILKQSRIPTS